MSIKNRVATTFHSIGALQIVFGAISFIAFLVRDPANALWISLALLVNGLLNYAIGEIIDLLQRKLDKQDVLIRIIAHALPHIPNSASPNVPQEANSVLQDI